MLITDDSGLRPFCCEHMFDNRQMISMCRARKCSDHENLFELALSRCPLWKISALLIPKLVSSTGRRRGCHVRIGTDSSINNMQILTDSPKETVSHGAWTACSTAVEQYLRSGVVIDLYHDSKS